MLLQRLSDFAMVMCATCIDPTEMTQITPLEQNKRIRHSQYVTEGMDTDWLNA